MYTYLIGEDEHFDLQWHKSRSDAEEYLKRQLSLYAICYDENNAKYDVIADREFYRMFDKVYHNSVTVRRLGNKLLDRIDEVKSNRV
ncbi:hypothetical protein EBB07_28430 [Paenibacillaceae bacterium]|nr:hypothetical protein EBB07_28430 [Paenibacillaceae bacterium]